MVESQPSEGPAAAGARKYALFISYASDPDARSAAELTRFLESFHRLRIPDSLRPASWKNLKQLEVCLDGETFSHPPTEKADSQVEHGKVREVIERYLAQSDELLVLCSHNAQVSPWVEAELAWWMEHRGPGSVRVALTQDPGPEGGSPFPELILRHGLHERIYYDFRGFRKRGSSRVKDLDSEKVRLAADLNGIPPDEVLPLWLRDRLRSLRRRVALGAAAALAILAAVSWGGWAALDASRERGLKQQAEANTTAQKSLKLVAQSSGLLERDPAQALVFAHEADSTHPSESTAEALRAACRVLTFRTQNLREQVALAGGSGVSLAARLHEGKPTTLISSDGVNRLLITDRGARGAGVPNGRIYLQNVQTLRTVELLPPEDWSESAEIEFVGFNSRQDRVLVVRYFRLAIYDLAGSLVGSYKFSRFTKDPLHHVSGPLRGRYYMGADSSGGVWLVDPETGEEFVLQREHHGDMLRHARIDDSGTRAVLVFQSGRAALLSWPSSQAEPRLRKLTAEGARFADLAASGAERILAVGRGGLLRTWAEVDGRPQALAQLNLPTGDLDWGWLSPDGTHAVAVSSDHVIYLVDLASEEILRQVAYASELDDPSWRAVPAHLVPSGGRLQEVGGRQWLATERGAFLIEGDCTIPVTSAIHATLDIQAAGGSTWIRTTSDDYGVEVGPTFRVEGYMAQALPEQIEEVEQIAALGERCYLASKGGLFSWSREQGYRAVEGIDHPVEYLRTDGVELWAFGDDRAYQVGPRGLRSFPEIEWPVSGVVFGDSESWLTCRPTRALAWPPDPGPVYRVTASGCEVVLGGEVFFRSVQRAGDGTWLLEGAEESPGPAHYWSGGRRVELPGPQVAVAGLFEAGGSVWLAEQARAGQVLLHEYDARGETRELVLTCSRVCGLDTPAGQTWILTDVGAYRIEGGAILRSPPPDERSMRAAVECAGLVWLLGEGGALRVRGARMEPIPVPGHTVLDLREVHGTRWLLTGEQAVYGPAYLLGDDDRITAFMGGEQLVLGVEERGEQIAVRVAGYFESRELLFDKRAPSTRGYLYGTAGVESVKLHWSDRADDRRTDTLVQRRSLPAESYEDIATVAAGMGVYEDRGLEPGRDYAYRVYGVDALGRRSPEPAEETVSLPPDEQAPGVPANVAAVALDGAVQLRWSPVEVEDLIGYEVWRSSAVEASWSRLSAEPVEDEGFLDLEVENGQAYDYAVVALDRRLNPSPRSDPATATPLVVHGKVWINELHYDNEEGDRGEFVEIAGPAGTILSGWSLALYNGGAPYDQVLLFGALPDQGQGLGALSFRAQLQNGPADGLALLDSAHRVVEFLSYEGPLRAVDGEAAGMDALELPVQEDGDTREGYSLQRTGPGRRAGDFKWSGPGPASPGSLNAGQRISAEAGGPGGGVQEAGLAREE